MTCPPRFGTPRTPERPTFGPKVAQVAATLPLPARRLDGGSGFLPWQHEVVNVACEVDEETGRFAYQTVVLVVPRQAGKSLLFLALALQRMRQIPMAKVWFTQQTGQWARKMLLETWAPMLESKQCPWSEKVHVRKSIAQGEGFRMKENGSLFGIFPPQPDALHSQQTDLVAIDEAWSFSAERGRGLLTASGPGMATRPMPQTWIISAAGNDTSTWLHEIQLRGRSAVRDGSRKDLAYFEWSAGDDINAVDIYDPKVWMATHPALGHTIDVSFIAAEAASNDRAEFARNYLCIPVHESNEQVIAAVDWEACQDDRSEMIDPVTFAIDVNPERSAASIAVCSYRLDGLEHVEMVEHRPGTGWLFDRVVELNARWSPSAIVGDGHGPAMGTLDQLGEAGILCVRASVGDMVTASGGFYDAVVNRRLRHKGQQPLDAAVFGVAKRPVGDAWAWGRKTSAVDISPLVACSLARWQATKYGAPVEMRIY